MISLVRSPWKATFSELVESISSSLIICSPYVTRHACELISENRVLAKKHATLSVYILTDLSRDNMLSGSTDPSSLELIVRRFPQSSVRFLPSLHAKVYIADERRAIVTSANFTEKGLARNYEYGVSITDPSLVSRIRQDVLDYGELGSSISPIQLSAFATAANELRQLKLAAERAIKSKFRAEFDERLDQVDLDILRARTGGEAPNQIFERAVIYILRDGPLSTPQIHEAVRAVHPDLCDDNVDRVIDGQHYGKKWKHAVRSAQYHLKKGGVIKHDRGLWQLVTRQS